MLKTRARSLAAPAEVAIVLSMEDIEVGHWWAQITDLTDDDRASASEELPALARTWEQVRGTLDPRQVDDFNERLKREWAIETGIIERLYSLDRGTTKVLIKQGIDASLIASDATDQPPDLVAGIIRDHAEAVDWLFDAVTTERPLSTSFLKQLHQFMTRKQVYATGIDMFGRKHEIELRHGEFKVRPNNPVRPDGKLHEYCPPEHTDAEIDRLIEMHHQHSETSTAPDVSAAWLHHRFAQIHPFQDGNGRIARAIASLVLIGAGWFPLVITRDDRTRYISALEQADDGDLSPLIRLVAELQRKWFVRAITIAEDVKRESLHLEQMLDVIGDMFGTEPATTLSDLHRAVETAETIWFQCRERCDELKEQLEARLGVSNGRRIWCDYGTDEDARRRTWNRYQVVETARKLDYFANTRVHHEWVRLGIQTENGRSEILTSFHGIGTEYRGLVGVSVCFYRRQQPEDTEDDSDGTTPVSIQQQIIELQPVTDEVFQINYEEPLKSVEHRFHGWLERAFVLALDQWRRGE